MRSREGKSFTQNHRAIKKKKIRNEKLTPSPVFPTLKFYDLVSIRIQAKKHKAHLNGAKEGILMKGLFAKMWSEFLDPTRLGRHLALARISIITSRTMVTGR